MNIIQLSPQDALHYWPTISPMLESARQQGQGETSLADYMKKILNHLAQCWVIIEDDKITGAGLTEFLLYSQHKTLHIIAFAGSHFEEQSKMFSTIIEFSKVNGCKAIENWGRKGWAKTLPKYLPEFKEVYTVFRYDLNKEQNEN